jgi:hypothetical protein
MYFSKSNYSLQVQYDYIKNHIDYMDHQYLPPLDYMCYINFSKYYDNIAYLKWFCNLNIGQCGSGGYFTTYCNYAPQYIIIKYTMTNPSKNSIRICLDKIYQKRKKEFYESQVLEMAYKMRIMKRVRLNQPTINSILSYLIIT